jgi:hypothetical protein
MTISDSIAYYSESKMVGTDERDFCAASKTFLSLLLLLLLLNTACMVVTFSVLLSRVDGEVTYV